MADTQIKLNQIHPDGSSAGQFIQFNGTDWVKSSVLYDNALSIADNTDNTKLATFDASAITTGTTRTYTFPNASGTLALLSDISILPAGANYNLQYYSDGDLGADSNITVTPGATPKLAIGTDAPNASLHGKSWNTIGASVLLLENSSGNDIINVSSAGFIKLGDNETYPRFFSSTSNGTQSYTGQGITFEGYFVDGSTTEILSIGTPATDLSSGDYKIFAVGGTFSPSTSSTSTLSVINLTTSINQTGVTSGITRGINIAPSSVTNLQDFRGVEISINNANAKGIYQTGSLTTNNFVGRTTFGSTNSPNASALIDMVSTTLGFGLPSMTSTERNAIGTPRDGLMVYNSTDNLVSVRANGSWVNLSSGGSGDVSQNGNSFGAAMVIGTNDDNSLSLETNGVTRATISSGASTGGQLTLTEVTANTNTTTDTLVIRANSTGTVTNGFGTGILFQGESSTTENRDMARINTAWSDTTDATRTSYISFSNVSSGTFAERIRITHNFINFQNAYTLNGGSSSLTIASQANSNSSIQLLPAGDGSRIQVGGWVWNNTSGNKTLFAFASSFAPTSGTGTFKKLLFETTINQTGGANGNIWAIEINPTLTALGGIYYGVDIAVNSTNAKGIYQTGSLTTNNFVGRTTFGSTNSPNASALIDMVSTTLGLGLPSMTSTQRDTISTPRDGLMVYNSTDNSVSVRANGSWVNLGTGGGGISTLNTLTGSTQTFATGTSGTNFNISSVGTTHTFNIPNASYTNTGLVTTTSQTFSGAKKFADSIELGDPTYFSAGQLKIYSENTGTYVAIQVPGTVPTSYTMSLPASFGTSGNVLKINSVNGTEWVKINPTIELGVSSGAVITTGAKGRKVFNLTGTIKGWKLITDTAATVTVDIWKANASIPTNSNSITGSAKPSITAGQFASSTTLTGWTTSVGNNDVFILEVEANDYAQYILLVLDVEI